MSTVHKFTDLFMKQANLALWNWNNVGAEVPKDAGTKTPISQTINGAVSMGQKNKSLKYDSVNKLGKLRKIISGFASKIYEYTHNIYIENDFWRSMTYHTQIIQIIKPKKTIICTQESEWKK